MRRSVKLIVGLVPVIAGSAGTVVYLTSKNSISNLSEVDVSRQKIVVETRVSPISSSQDSQYNQNSEKLENKKPNVQNTQKHLVDSNLNNNLEKTSKKIDSSNILLSKNIKSISSKTASKTESKILLDSSSNNFKSSQSKKDNNNVQEKLVKKYEQNKNTISVIAPEKSESSDSTPKKSEIIQKVVLINKPIEKKSKKDKSNKPDSVISTIVSNSKATPKNSKPQTIPEVAKIQEIPEVIIQNQPKPEEKMIENNQEIENPIDFTKVSGSETSQQTVERIVKGLEQDLKILIKNPVGKDLEKWKAAKKRLYEYRFTSNNQMAMFKEKFPKNPITEKQAGYLYDFWENNYAHFYPSMARSSTSRKNWRNELQKILNIVKDPEVGAFNRVSGGHVFIFDPKTNNNQWLDPQVQNSPTLKKK